MGFDDDLDHRRVQRVALVDRCSAPLYVMHIGTLVGDDKGALELPHVLGVDPEVSLQWDIDLHTGRHVDERPARPHCGVERGELVIAGRDHGAEILPEHLRVFFERGVGVEEDHALLLEVLADRVVDDFRFVLRRHTRDQSLLLGFGDTQSVVGVLDVLREFVPGCGLLFTRAHEVLDVVEVDALEVGTPVRHRLLVERPQRLESDVEHPLRFTLLR